MDALPSNTHKPRFPCIIRRNLYCSFSPSNMYRSGKLMCVAQSLAIFQTHSLVVSLRAGRCSTKERSTFIQIGRPGASIPYPIHIRPLFITYFTLCYRSTVHSLKPFCPNASTSSLLKSYPYLLTVAYFDIGKCALTTHLWNGSDLFVFVPSWLDC